MKLLSGGEENQVLTVAVHVRHDDISCSKLDEKLLHELQRGVVTDGQRSLCDRS